MCVSKGLDLPAVRESWEPRWDNGHAPFNPPQSGDVQELVPSAQCGSAGWISDLHLLIPAPGLSLSSELRPADTGIWGFGGCLLNVPFIQKGHLTNPGPPPLVARSFGTARRIQSLHNYSKNSGQQTLLLIAALRG